MKRLKRFWIWAIDVCVEVRGKVCTVCAPYL